MSTFPRQHPTGIVSVGHAAAANMRRSHAVAHPRMPRADGLIWTAMLLLTLIGAGGLFGGIWWVNRPAPPIQMVEMRIGAEKLVFPSNYKGPQTPDMSREVGMTRLRVTWPELSAAAPGDKAEVHITIGPAEHTTDPRAQFATLARFLTPGAWSNPGGLVVRSFKKGSPFESDELFMSLPDGADFFARCSADMGSQHLDEGCRAVLKYRGFDITLRFPREALTEWRTLSAGVRSLIDGFHRPG